MSVFGTMSCFSQSHRESTDDFKFPTSQPSAPPIHLLVLKTLGIVKAVVPLGDPLPGLSPVKQVRSARLMSDCKLRISNELCNRRLGHFRESLNAVCRIPLRGPRLGEAPRACNCCRPNRAQCQVGVGDKGINRGLDARALGPSGQAIRSYSEERFPMVDKIHTF
jgi:hypothetical protein